MPQEEDILRLFMSDDSPSNVISILAGVFLSSSGRSLEKYLSFAWPKAEQYVLR